MIGEYYQEQDFKYNEIATVLEDFEYRSKGKFFINSITPLISSSSPFNDKKGKKTTSNIINYSAKLAITSYTISNYVLLSVPEYMLTSNILTVINEISIIKKGTKFIITFVGGDINKPRIIGVY